MIIKAMVIFLLLSLVSLCGGSEDWSLCSPCECKWVSGKRTANCQGLGLKTIPRFPMADKIQVMHIDNNPIGQLTDMAFVSVNLINLQKVYMANCSLNNVHPGAFSSLVILIELDMSGNNLRTLHSGTFKGNIRLRKLWLTGNPIRSLHGYQFPELPHLRIVDLSHGRLVRLGRQTFANLGLVEVLHLDHNRFRRLEKKTFIPMENLKSLTLQGNPWHCDCRLQEFWQWLMYNNLFNSPTACASPPSMKGNEWDKLSFKVLACAPVVYVPQPMVAVSTGRTATLACLVNESPEAQVQWVTRLGQVVRNNSVTTDLQKFSVTTGRAEVDIFSTVVPIDGRTHPKRDPNLYYSTDQQPAARKIWFNLTIENVQMSAGYTCRAKNQGGVADANVTLVYSESVATYLDNRDISVLLATGLAAGVLVFLTLGAGVICFAMQRKQRYQLRRQHMAASSEAAAEPKNQMHMEMVEVNVGTGDESVEATNSWPTGNATAASDNTCGDGGADQVDANNDRENLCPERQDDSGCGGSTSTSNNADQAMMASTSSGCLPQPDVVQRASVTTYPSPGWTSSSIDSDSTLTHSTGWYGWNQSLTPYQHANMSLYVGSNGGNATLPRGGCGGRNYKSDEQQHRLADLSGGEDSTNLNKRGYPVAFDLMAEMRNNGGGGGPLQQLWEMPEYPSSQITSSLRRQAGHFPTEHLEDNHQPIATTTAIDNEKTQAYYRSLHSSMGYFEPSSRSITPSNLPSTPAQLQLQMAQSQSFQEQAMLCPPSSSGSVPPQYCSTPRLNNSPLLWTNIVARKVDHQWPPPLARSSKRPLESIQESSVAIFEDATAAVVPCKQGVSDFVTNPAMLAQEMKSHSNTMLNALVKDKNDTPV